MFGTDTKPVILAPMAGVTDWAYRTICAELGADVTVTEMVSSRALVYQDRKSVGLLRKNAGSVVGAQLFGNDPEIMAQAAVLALEHSGCDFIDINMGCPVPKVANNGDGSGLMRDLPLAGRIVAAMKKAVGVPVTVKCRLGWDRGSINVVEFAKCVADSGADAIAVHGRTRSMQYSGSADWDAITAVKRAVSIPVIANGDIVSGEDAVHCIRRTGADGVMLGRGVFGNPWLCAEVKAALCGEPIPERPPLRERIALAHRQILLAAEDKGEKIACLEARKQLSWYLRGVAHSGYWKEQISCVQTLDEVARIVKGIANDLR